ncbi:fibronectin type III domain-containing protein 7-like isoform X2 [Vanacampus margaritifer]
MSVYHQQCHKHNNDENIIVLYKRKNNLLCNKLVLPPLSVFTASVFAITSRSATLLWDAYPGATSYLITVSLEGSQDIVAFIQFGENTVMGTVNSLSPNNLYVFTVQPLDINHNPLDILTVQSFTAPRLMDPIQNIKPKDSQTLIFEFNLVTGATHYIVRIQNSDGFYREDTVYSSPAEITSLTPYTEYTLRIMAANSGGHNQPSPSVIGKTVLPPLQLYTSSPGNDSIVISWYPIDGAVQYTVAMYDVFSNATMKQNTTSTNLTLSGLEAGSLFMVMGYGWDAEGRKGEGSLYINQTTRPPIPASVEVSVVMIVDQAVLSVSWELNQEVYGNVEYYVMSDQNLTCNTTSSPCNLSPVGCGESHTIQVISSNEAGPGYPSIPVEFITFPCPPSSLALVESMKGNCTLSWDMEPYADNYRAYVKKGDGGEVTCNTTGNNCTYHCQCGYMFHMYVFAYNYAGSSPPGPELNYTTLPCCPEGVSVSLVSTETLEITWTASRGADLYETRAADISEVILCNDTARVCALSDLSCDSAYSVIVTPCNDMSGCNRACKAHTKDTEPCCPASPTVHQVNQAMTNVSWSHAKGAYTFLTSLTSPRGHASCHTEDFHCLMGCITCGTNYTVTMKAFSHSGRSVNCTYQGFSSSACCPSGVRMYKMAGNALRLQWRTTGSSHRYIAEIMGSNNNYNCTTSAGENSCDIANVQCGDIYHVMVAPLTPDGSNVSFCAQRVYLVSCTGGDVGTVMYRGKRSVDQ